MSINPNKQPSDRGNDSDTDIAKMEADAADFINEQVNNGENFTEMTLE